MEAIRAHVYALKPSPEQSMLLAQTAGVVRLVYNLALEQRRTWGGKPYGGGRSRSFNSKGSSRELADLRAALPWIAAVSQTAQNQALIDLDKAYAGFFAGRSGYPTPRKRGLNDAFRQAGREVAVRRLNGKWSEVKIPKIGWIRFRDTRALRLNAAGTAQIRSVTLRCSAGKWSIAISHQCEIAPQAISSAAIGVDRGVAIPFAMSDGTTVHLPRTMATRAKTARRAQAQLARKRRGSSRYAKARLRVARLAARNARTRAHVAHVLSRKLAAENGLVAIEKLRTRNMTASARGTLAEPGRNVAQKAGLNRAIQNVGWFMFETMLAYKLDETGGHLIRVPTAYTSQECACCGHVDARSRESQAAFVCTSCGVAANADTNASKVILARALRGDLDAERRWNTPLLDMEGYASAPCKVSTEHTAVRLNA